MTDVRSRIDANKITLSQYGVILICTIMNMLDGMDVMVISYAGPVLQEQWGISSQAWGFVLGSALLGMTLGAVFLAPKADVIGRRKVVISALIIMGVGVLLTAVAQTVWQLVVIRFCSGLGIGAMLASTVTLAAEYAPKRQRNFFVSLVLTGYPIGATLSGLVAAQVIPEHGWRAIFIIAGVVTIISLPLALFFLNESWEWLLKRQPENALDRLNVVLAKMDLEKLDELPQKSQEVEFTPGVATLLQEGRAESSYKIWIAFFAGFATLYYLTTWIPNLARNTGLTVEFAIYAGTVFNFGAIFGNIFQGLISQSIGLKKSINLFYISTAVAMVLFGYVSGDWLILSVFAVIGFGVQGGLIGLYAAVARLYPTEIRNTGVGWAIGAGRTGAIISPPLGGFIAGAGVTLANSLLIFAAPLVVACTAVWMIKSKEID